MKLRTHALALSAALLVLNAGAALAEGGVTFHDIAAGGGSGLSYTREPSVRLNKLLDFYSDGLVDVVSEYLITPEKPHGAPGVALLDFDGDGDLDIYVTNGPGTANSLFSNQLHETGHLSFTDVATAAGVDATAQDSQGVCFGDIDNDGDQDLYVLGMMEDNRLFENNGNGTFSDITAASGAGGGLRSSTSCAMGDVDADGLLDIFVSNAYDFDSRAGVTFVPFDLMQHNQLFVNQGADTFADESNAAGIEDITGIPVPGAALGTWPAAMVDYDLDGDLDIVYSPDTRTVLVADPLANNHIYQNDGSGHFTDVSASLGLTRQGSWRGLSWGDLNCDRRLDFFASNWGDYVFFAGTINPGDFASAWFLRQPDGTFSDPGPGSLVTVPNGWGNSLFDYDNDGDLDIAVYGNDEEPLFIDMSNPGVILQNQGCSGTFTWDQAALAGSTNHGLRAVQGLATGDLNRDGFEDVVSVSSTDMPADAPLAPFFFNPIGSIFDPTGLGIYSTVPADQTFAQFAVVWYEPVNGGLAVELNSANNGNRWVKVDLTGTKGLTTGGQANRDGIGAVVTFTSAPGDRAVSKPVMGGSSYASQNSLTQTFGLGSKRRGSVDVLWPGGTRNKLYGVFAGEHVDFPEIPCSYTGEFDSTVAYLQCVRGALDELHAEGVVNHLEYVRFFASALQAYLTEHGLPF